MGSHRLSITDTVKAGKIFESNPLRVDSGLFIKEGQYNLKVMCSTCDDKVLLEKKVKYYPKGEAAYAADLDKYNKTLNNSKKLEIEELESIVEVAKKQLALTEKNFKSKRTKNQWTKFSNSWLLNQNELVGLLSQLDKLEMQEKIYHLSLYLNLRKSVQTTFELHMAQEQSFDDKKDKKLMNFLSESIDTNKLDINSIENKIKAAQIKLKQEISESKVS